LKLVKWDWVGSFTGLAGAGLLALNITASPWGWLLFLVSNLAWFIFSLQRQLWALLMMQVGFTFTSFLGIWRWLL